VVSQLSVPSKSVPSKSVLSKYTARELRNQFRPICRGGPLWPPAHWYRAGTGACPYDIYPLSGCVFNAQCTKPVLSKSEPSKSVPSKSVLSKSVLSKSEHSKSASSKSVLSKTARCLLSHQGRKAVLICVLGLQLLFLWGCVPKRFSTLDYYQLADHLYNQEKYDRAAKLYNTFLTRDPQHPLADKAIFHLGKIYQKQKHYQEARSQFEKIIQFHPQSEYFLESNLEIGICSFYLQRYDEAISLFHKYLNYNHPGRELEVVRFLADSYFALKEYQKAFDEYSLLQLLAPHKRQDPEVLYQICLCQIHLKQSEQAVTQLKYLLATDFGAAHRVEIQQALTQADLMLKNPLEALDSLLKVRQYAENRRESAQYEEQISSLIQDQLSKEDLQKVAEKWGRNYPADLALIQLGYAWQKELQLPKAKHAWEQFLVSFPDHPQKKIISRNLEEMNHRLLLSSSKIGCIMPTSGDFAVYGDKVIKGIKLAIEEYNFHNNTNIQLVIADSRANPEYGKDGIKLLAEKEHVAAIIGPLLSSEAYALAPVIDEEGICTITPTAAGKGITESSSFFFRNCLTNPQQGKAIADYAVNSLMLQRFGILYPDDPYGLELMKIFAQEVSALGAQVEITESYREGETDFRKQLERINKIHPEGLFVPGYPEEIILVAPQIPFYDSAEVVPRQLPGESTGEKKSAAEGSDGQETVHPSDGQQPHPVQQEGKRQAMQLLGCDGWYSQRVISQGGGDVEGAVFTTGFFKESTDPQVLEFVHNYQKKYGSLPDLLSAQAYDTTNILLLALLSEKLTGEGLRDALSHTRDFAGVTGVTSFSSSGEASKKTFILTIRDKQFICLPSSLSK
jgi:branched-chain amino acid transport system substrate-binding protein